MKDIRRDFMVGFYVQVHEGVSLYACLYGTSYVTKLYVAVFLYDVFSFT